MMWTSARASSAGGSGARARSPTARAMVRRLPLPLSSTVCFAGVGQLRAALARDLSMLDPRVPHSFPPPSSLTHTYSMQCTQTPAAF
jgi:hypothetical protein